MNPIKIHARKPTPAEKTAPAFTALIVTYNSEDEISTLLTDLRSYPHPPRTIVIDNASQDQTVERVRAQFPEVQLIENAQNIGYARAVNQGIALCPTDFVFLLNPDIHIPSPTLFPALLACLAPSPRIAVAAPLQFKQTGETRSLNFTWSYIAPSALRIFLAHRFHWGHPDPTPRPVTFLNAGCLLIRKSAFMHVGKLNEKYFLYGEEPDLFLKLKRFGYECRLHPGEAVIHHRERSLNTVPSLKRLRFRVRGWLNILDALINGYFQLLLANLQNRRKYPQKSNRRRLLRGSDMSK
ncbi:MAG: glycosyltransferase family 2 protein [Anaerolineales bacterium]|nr:glycosyltransferase family 2 protein [Anaerolineales bacterium]